MRGSEKRMEEKGKECASGGKFFPMIVDVGCKPWKMMSRNLEGKMTQG